MSQSKSTKLKRESTTKTAKHASFNNDKQWQDASDGWVKSMHESRERKEKLREQELCNHGDYGWCDNCLTTVDGEKLVAI